MFESMPSGEAECPVTSLLAGLASYDGAGLADDALIDGIGLLERLKGAASAAQARLTVAFDASQRRVAVDRGVPVAEQGRGIAAQVALARRESPARGARWVGLAKALVGELPSTMAALTVGETTEWRATLIARETAALTLADRRAVDAELGPRLSGLGDRATGDEARKVAYRLDPASLVRRVAQAEADRTVTVRPAPDCMTYLTGVLPVAKGVAVYAALRQQSEAARAAGDERSLGQLMADLLVARVTGAPDEVGPDVHVSVVMSDQTLLSDSHEPARVAGHGVIPAWLARDLVRDAGRVWLRRLYAGPGGVIAADARSRFFPRAARDVLVARDQWCRTPWCGASIRHADYVVRAVDGGSTSLTNGQGLCATCNLAKEGEGWRARVAPGAQHRVETTTPTGHTYTSEVVRLPGSPTAGEMYLSRIRYEYAAS